MKRMRTLQNAIKEIKAADPNTALTYNGLRTWCNTGVLPFVLAGRTILIDLDQLERFLSGEAVQNG